MVLPTCKPLNTFSHPVPCFSIVAHIGAQWARSGNGPGRTRQGKGRTLEERKAHRRKDSREGGREEKGKRLQLDDFPDLGYTATHIAVLHQGRQRKTSRKIWGTTSPWQHGPLLAWTNCTTTAHTSHGTSFWPRQHPCGTGASWLHSWNSFSLPQGRGQAGKQIDISRKQKIHLRLCWLQNKNDEREEGVLQMSALRHISIKASWQYIHWLTK